MKDIVLKYIDILILTVTKLDETFLISEFLMDGFCKPYRFDRNENGGEVMVYIRDTTPSKILEKHICPNDIECIFIGLNLRKCKWLLCGTYHSLSQFILIILIKPLTLTAIKKMFWLLEISTQK